MSTGDLWLLVTAAVLVVLAGLFAAAEAAHPSLRSELAKGDFSTLVGWLRSHIHGKASSRSTRQLLTEATGRPLDAGVFKAHLKRRYLA